MTLVSMTEAKGMVGVADDRTFKKMVRQYKIKRFAIGQRIKFDKDEIKRKINYHAQ